MRTMIAITTVRGSRPPIWQVASYTGLLRPPATDFRIGAAHEGVSQNRNALAEHALQGGYDRVLFLDDDIQFPVDGLLAMLSWEHPAVTGVYFLRLGHVSVGQFVGRYSWSPVSWPPDSPWGEVTMAAGGCLLLDVRVLRRLDPPWWKAIPGRCSEDVYFARRLQDELSLPFLADLRVRCGHETAVWLEPSGRATVKMEPRRIVVA